MYRIIGADGKEYGPVSADQLRHWIAEGRADANTRIAVEGSSDWKPLAMYPEFSHLLASMPRGPVMAPVQKSNSMAVASMVLGILSLMFCFCCYGIPFNVLGIVFSLIALTQIRNEPERYTGKNLAVAGLVLSLLSIVLSIIFFVVVGLSSGWSNATHPRYKL
jgi:hypothetical protein